jgi:hypothetical protein
VGVVESIKGVFSFLTTRGRGEDRMAEYVIREHRRGRPLQDILQDHYVTNRCSPEQIRRLLDRPEVVHALGDDVITAVQSTTP